MWLAWWWWDWWCRWGWWWWRAWFKIYVEIKITKADLLLERINCEDWNSSFKIRSEHGLLFSLLVHRMSRELFVRSGDTGVDLFWLSKKLFFDSFTVFLIPLKNVPSWLQFAQAFFKPLLFCSFLPGILQVTAFVFLSEGSKICVALPNLVI